MSPEDGLNTKEQEHQIIIVWFPSIFSYHRLDQVGRYHSGLSGPNSLLKPGYSRAHCIGLCPDDS